MGGFSKAYAMTGWRVGWLCRPGRRSSRASSRSTSTGSCRPRRSPRTPRWPRSSSGEPDGRADGRRVRPPPPARSSTGSTRIGLETFEPRGAFYAFPRISSTGLTSDEFTERLLPRRAVAVVPGNAFGPSGEGHVRMCYATSYEQLEEALARIGRLRGAGPAGLTRRPAGSCALRTSAPAIAIALVERGRGPPGHVPARRSGRASRSAAGRRSSTGVRLRGFPPGCQPLQKRCFVFSGLRDPLDDRREPVLQVPHRPPSQVQPQVQAVGRAPAASRSWRSPPSSRTSPPSLRHCHRRPFDNDMLIHHARMDDLIRFVKPQDASPRPAPPGAAAGRVRCSMVNPTDGRGHYLVLPAGAAPARRRVFGPSMRPVGLDLPPEWGDVRVPVAWTAGYTSWARSGTCTALPRRRQPQRPSADVERRSCAASGRSRVRSGAPSSMSSAR